MDMAQALENKYVENRDFVAQILAKYSLDDSNSSFATYNKKSSSHGWAKAKQTITSINGDDKNKIATL